MYWYATTCSSYAVNPSRQGISCALTIALAICGLMSTSENLASTPPLLAASAGASNCESLVAGAELLDRGANPVARPRVSPGTWNDRRRLGLQATTTSVVHGVVVVFRLLPGTDPSIFAVRQQSFAVLRLPGLIVRKATPNDDPLPDNVSCSGSACLALDGPGIAFNGVRGAQPFEILMVFRTQLILRSSGGTCGPPLFWKLEMAQARSGEIRSDVASIDGQAFDAVRRSIIVGMRRGVARNPSRGFQ